MSQFLVHSFVILPLIGLIICGTVAAIEWVEEGDTPEAEEKDMVKAKAFSKTYFWRQMLEGWNCSEESLEKRIACMNDDYAGVRVDDELIEARCKSLKRMATASDRYVRNWGKEGQMHAENAASPVKPEFQVKVGTGYRQIRLSSAMEVIKLLFLEMFVDFKDNSDLRYIEFNCVNENKFETVQENETSLNTVDFFAGLTYEETKKGKQRNYLRELKKALEQLKIFASAGDVKKAHNEYEKLWPLLLEIGIDSTKCAKT
ncbi:hypothetical protein niasHS_011580 [Heterodera schachtii]|uniref:Uncharacterized protein n=1 Tax=Heterodera schachtii TaxID=97005 RepID=A0ABD2IIF4_HETSC